MSPQTRPFKNRDKELTKEQKILLKKIKADDTLKLFFENNDHFKEGSRRDYERAIREYCLLNELTPTQVIEKALQEEENGIHLSRRKIKLMLLKFKTDMLKRELSYNYMNNTFKHVKKFYTDHEIQVPQTIKIKRPEYDPEPSDEASAGLPSLEMIQEALEYCSPKWRAIITLMTSSGMGAAEVQSMTYKMWLDAISCKHLLPDARKKQGNYVNLDNLTDSQKLNVIKIDEIIKETGQIVPVYEMKRKKTNFSYKTFGTPESVHEISTYLRHREIQGLSIENFEDPLFITKNKKGVRKLNSSDFTNQFRRLRGKFQKNNGYKKHGNQYVWRSHSMRRYAGSMFLHHASLDFFKSEWLLGHKRTGQDRTYYNTHIDELRKDYMTGLPKLSIHWNEEVLATAHEYMNLKQSHNTLLDMAKEQMNDKLKMDRKITELKNDKNRLERQYKKDFKAKDKEIQQIKADMNKKIQKSVKYSEAIQDMFNMVMNPDIERTPEFEETFGEKIKLIQKYRKDLLSD